MPKLVFRKKDAFLWIGGLLASVGSVLLKIFDHRLYIGGPVFVAGAALLLYGGLGIATKGTRIIEEWDSKVLFQAIRDAAPSTTIRILQTSIPDVTGLIGLLEDLFTRQDKHFRLRILLLDYENAAQLLTARMKYRVETPQTMGRRFAHKSNNSFVSRSGLTQFGKILKVVPSWILRFDCIPSCRSDQYSRSAPAKSSQDYSGTGPPRSTDL